MTPTRWFAVDDRPGFVAPDGTVRGLDLTSGALRVEPRAVAEADEIDAATFERLLRVLRRVISHDRQVAPIAWEATGDGERPYRAMHAGTRYTIYAGDVPVEARYTLEVEGEAVDHLDAWPDAWTKPG